MPPSPRLRLPSWHTISTGPTAMRRLFNIYPPFVGAGIRVREISDDWRRIRVEMGLTPLNRNYVGTQFGGSLFAMADPFWMIMVMRALGPDYVVWDKAAEIDFVSPGKGRVRADFVLTDELVDDLRARAADGSKVLHWCEVEIRGTKGETVARVRKQLYVRLRQR